MNLARVAVRRAAASRARSARVTAHGQTDQGDAALVAFDVDLTENDSTETLPMNGVAVHAGRLRPSATLWLVHDRLALELYPAQIFASTEQRIAAGVLLIGCLFAA